MDLVMSGLDYRRTPLDLRQRLAFSQAETARLLAWLRQQPGVRGCVPPSTCNRTELYLSGELETPWRPCSACSKRQGLQNL